MVVPRIKSILLCAATLAGFLKGISAQESTEAGTTEATSIFSFIDYSLALYILIGIAVVYSIITLIFFVLVVLNCFCHKKAGIQRRVSPYANLNKRPLLSRLETIFEEGESKCSSQTSLTAAKQQKTEVLTFHNRNALDVLERETAMGPSIGLIGTPDMEGTLSIVNKSALEQDSHGDEEFRERGALQDTTPSSDLILSTRQHALSFSNRTALERENSNGEDKVTRKRALEMTGLQGIITIGTRKHASSGSNRTALEHKDDKTAKKGAVPAIKLTSDDTRKHASSISSRTALEHKDDKTVGKGAIPDSKLASDVSGGPRKHTLSFSNRTALEREMSKDEKTTVKGAIPAIKPASHTSSGFRKHALSFSNRTALERENSEGNKETSDVGKLERGTDITTSFRRPVPLEKMNEKENAKSSPQTSPRKSPFLQHIPKGASISPADVKVPYTDNWEEPKSSSKSSSTGKQNLKGDVGSPSRSRPASVSSTGHPASMGSPFGKRKNQAKEIPSSDASTLTKFKKKTSTAALPLPPQEDTEHSAGKVTLPPLKTTASNESTGSFGVATSQSETTSCSPARSRPKPINPVRSSPASPSPFQDRSKLKPLRKRAWTQGSNERTPTQDRPHSTDSLRSESPLQAEAARDSTPGIVEHSLTASEKSKSSEARRSSVASISSTASSLLTVDVLAKKLEPVQKKWYIIGSQLKVPSRHLNQLRNENKADSESCLSMCEEWVSKFKEAATWPKVVDALKTDLVDEKVLACDLEREFCWVESNTSKTWL